jgi:hypothetical protein
MRQITDISIVACVLSLSLQSLHQPVHRRRAVEKSLDQLIAELWAALGATEHQIKELAASREEAAVVGCASISIYAKVLIHCIGTKGEHEFRAPPLVALGLE